MNQAIQKFINNNSGRADKYIAILNEMLESNEYRYAEQTLYGILQTIEDSRFVTGNQVEAIENIQAKPNYNWD